MDEEKAKAEKLFNERVTEGRLEGEKMCSEMITVACKNVTIGSSSDEFCEEFFFFSTALDDVKRLKRRDDHLYGSFYQKVSQNHRHHHHGQG